MMMSKREKYIAGGVIAAVALFALDYALLDPYFKTKEKIATQSEEVNRLLSNADETAARKRRLDSVWSEMQRGGLKVDPSQAETQSLKAILDWARSAGVELASLRPERASKEGKFQVISFSVTGTGPMVAVSKFLWSLETATIPVRVSDMQVTPRREGQDDLSIRLSVSALCMPPDPDKPANGTNAAASVDRGGTQ